MTNAHNTGDGNETSSDDDCIGCNGTGWKTDAKKTATALSATVKADDYDGMNCDGDDCPHPEHAGLTGELDEIEYTPYEPVAMEFNGCQDPDCDGEY